MNAYDFDKTIYKRDCSTDFFIYMVFSRPYLLLFFPWFLMVFALYGCKALSKKKTKECLFFFVPWYKNIDKIVDKFGGKKGVLLDLGCGTGSLTECFCKLGYDCLGIDISQEMLTVALDKKIDNDLPIQYLHQDMRKLKLFGGLDVTVCALDALNHLSSLDDILKTFKSVSKFTNPDGLFIFDMNTIYKHKNILSDNTFAYDMDEVYCVWQNTYKTKKNEVLILW